MFLSFPLPTNVFLSLRATEGRRAVLHQTRLTLRHFGKLRTQGSLATTESARWERGNKGRRQRAALHQTRLATLARIDRATF